MTTSDPIADMLTRVRNTNTAKYDMVDVSAFKIKVVIVGVLVNEGYVEKYEFIESKGFQDIRIILKCGATKNDRTLSGLKRISKPDLRIYAGKEDAPEVLGGLGTATTSTDQDTIIDEEACRLGIGGEVLAFTR